MAEMSKIRQVSQLGSETTAGTPVAATKRVLALSFEPKPEGSIGMFRPMGYLFDTVASPEKEWSSSKITGLACYNALTYMFSGLLHKTTPTGGGTAKTWQWNISSTKDNTPQTFTLEHGSNVRAKQIAFGLISEMSLDFQRSAIKFDGTMLGQRVTDGFQLSTSEVQTVTITGTPTGGTFTLTFGGNTTTGIAYNAAASAVQTALTALASIGAGNVAVTGGPGPGTPYTVTFTGTLAQATQATMTASGASLTGGSSPAVAVTEATAGAAPTEIASVPVLSSTIDLFIDTTAAASLGTTQMQRGFMASFKMSNRYSGIWPLNSSKPSWDGFVEDAPPTELGIMLAADSVGMAYLTQMRAGTTLYVRVQATGGAISGGGNYSLIMDFAAKMNKVFEYKDADNIVYAADYQLAVAHDVTWGKAMQVTLINTLTAL